MPRVTVNGTELYFEIRGTGPPVLLIMGATGDGLLVFAEIAGRFGKRLGVDVAAAPGRHAAYHEQPHELAEVVRPFLRQVSGVQEVGLGGIVK
jgi:hypothetical protein